MGYAQITNNDRKGKIIDKQNIKDKI